jgi:molybdopterin synthase sulfur carrier subunit
MNVTLKLYTTLADYLPVEARKTNEVALTVVEDATVGALIEQCNLPKKLVHLVLVNGHFVPPAARGAHTLSEGDVLASGQP